MPTSKARRRLALKTSALVVAGAGVFFGVPALANSMAPKAVTYTCTNVSTSTDTEIKFQMDLTGPVSAVSPSATAVVTWKIGTPSPTLTAPTQLAQGDRLVIEADAIITGSPSPTPSELRTAVVTNTPGAIALGSPLQPLPTVLVSLTPTARGTMAVIPYDFTLRVGTAAGGNVALYDCTVTTGKESEATQAAALITVATGSSSPSSSPTTPTPTATTPTPTPTTPTATPTTARPTKTTTVIVTETPAGGGKVRKTPKDGADTGAGGDMGPDGRMFILSGALLIMAAGAGGLILRRRNISKG
ncbi:hypothetical protein [Nonomuraea longicatena]|uniref:Gram-positive cocci surface proteins LPxTG domain-containing protein n=1 Tax=Nonomuraea longicatena TaxID=83682 RepID=A0ABN1QUS7_9ACTN